MHLFYFGKYFIGLRVQEIFGFCVGFQVELFVRGFDINVSTSP